MLTGKVMGAAQAESAASKATSVVVGHATTPFMSMYRMTDAGYLAKYSDPTSLPGTSINSAAFSPDGNYLAVTRNATGFLLYSLLGGGIGTQTTVSPGIGAISKVAFAPDNSAVAVVGNTSPFVAVYAWSSAGIVAKFANPSTLPVGCVGVAFSPDSDALVITSGTSPYIEAYAWSTSGFGSKYADPSTLPGSAASGVSFSPDGLAVATTLSTSPYVAAYQWSTSGFGSKYSNPSTALSAAGNAVAFSPDSSAVAIAAATTTTGASIYAWDSASGFGTRYSTANVGNPAKGVTFSNDGTQVFFAGASSPYIHGWPWSGSALGTKFTAPSVLPTGTGQCVAYSPYVPYSYAAVFTRSTSPYIVMFPFYTDTATFGTQFSDPAVIPGGMGQTTNVHTTNGAVLCFDTTSPYIHAWAADAFNGFGTKYADPATLIGTGSFYWSAMNPAKTVILAGNSSTLQTIYGYPWSDATGFGTQLTPVQLLPSNVYARYQNSVAFSADGTAVAFGVEGSPYITVYAWDDATGFGTKYADPAILPTTSIRSVAFSPDGTAIAYGGQGYNQRIREWSSGTGFGSTLSVTSTFIQGCAWSPDGSYYFYHIYSTGLIGAGAWTPGVGVGTTTNSSAVSAATATGFPMAITDNAEALIFASQDSPYAGAFPFNGTWGSRTSNPSTGVAHYGAALLKT